MLKIENTSYSPGVYRKLRKFQGISFLLITLAAVAIISSQTLAGGQPWNVPKEEPDPIAQRFRLTNVVFSHIKDYYIDFHNLAVTEVLGDALKGIEEVMPNLKVDVRAEEVLVQLDGSTKGFETVGIRNWLVLRELLKEVITFIESSGSCPLGTTELEYAALNGILNAFDPYSRVYRPEDLERVKTLGSGSFVGLGMDVELKEGFLTVTEVYKDSPAFKAGIRLGDRILEIEGESTKNMGLAEALSRMSGPQDTSITLSVLRNGEVMSFTLKRERIELEPAEWTLLEGGLGYIKLKGFQEGAFYSMVKAVRGLEEGGGLRGLVLDLRNNYGGVMEEIIKVSELFLPSGIITIKTRTGEKLPEFVNAHPSGRPEEECPIVVLMDGGSASGAEILSATLRDNGRALLVGEQTFGKACIQQVFRLQGKYALKLTTARYFTPRGEYINQKGLKPDVLLVPIRVEKEKTALFPWVRYAQGDKGGYADAESPTDRQKVLCYLDRQREESGSGGLQKDFQIQLARGLLKTTLSGGRKTVPPAVAGASHFGGLYRDSLWQNCQKVVKESQEEEDGKIVKILESRKIDWSAGPAEGIPTSVASLNIDKEEVEAGDTVTLTLSVENCGQSPLYRVLARSSSGNPAFDRLEFPIGRVEPGGRGSYSLRAKVPDDSLDRQDEIVLKFTEDNDFPPADVVKWIVVWARPTPLFAYSCRLPQVQKGEETGLSLKVKNIGHGPSCRGVVVLKGDEEAGTVVLKGRQELGVLKPGEEKEVKLAFALTGTAQKLKPLKLHITDPLLGTQLSAGLPLRLEGGAEDMSGLPPYLILQDAVLQAVEGLVELSFLARDDRHLQGAYVKVNGRKVFFGYNPEPTTERVFTASLPIVKGPNLVRIAAYDDAGLSSEKVFVITGR
jgi:carboxyl-terminal processing protease